MLLRVKILLPATEDLLKERHCSSKENVVVLSTRSDKGGKDLIEIGGLGKTPMRARSSDVRREMLGKWREELRPR